MPQFEKPFLATLCVHPRLPRHLRANAGIGAALISPPLVFDGVPLPASYANFHLANKRVLVPTFHDPNDRVALNVRAECFPDGKVVGISCVELVWGLGTLHCIRQQQPSSVF